MSDKYTVGNKLPSKQVSILAKRKKRIAHDESINKLKSKTIRKALHKKSLSFHKPEYFIKEFLLKERDNNRIRRGISRTTYMARLPENQSLLLVFRHRAHKVVNQTVQTALNRLGVEFLNTASLVRVTKQVKTLLKIVEPYIAYGYPTINTVRDLIFKHGFMTVDGKRVPMTSNAAIEAQIGETGVICVEDVIHELFTVGPNFAAVKNFVGSFKLNPPRDGYQKKGAVSFERGGENGNRGKEINDLIQRCM